MSNVLFKLQSIYNFLPFILIQLLTVTVIGYSLILFHSSADHERVDSRENLLFSEENRNFQKEDTVFILFFWDHLF